MTSHDYRLALTVDRHNQAHEDDVCQCERTVGDKGLMVTWDIDPACPLHGEEEL